jgi:hypothetical protein
MTSKPEVFLIERRPALYVKTAVEEIALDGPSGIVFVHITMNQTPIHFFRNFSASSVAVIGEAISWMRS